MKRWAGALLAAAAVSVLSVDPAAFPAVAPDARAELTRAVALYDSLAVAAANPAAVTADGALALGYLERLRLGLGSPFRLVDQARQDPRLLPATRHTVAWALLGHTLAGDSYEIEPSVLEGGAADGAVAGRGAPFGAWHLRLIDRAITTAADPRAGELAVRLGYALGRGERSVSGAVAVTSAQAAALLRDRELARRDAVRLLDAARDSQVDPLLLVAAWRAERRVEVERPALAEAPGAALEAQALERGERIAEELRRFDDVARLARAARDTGTVDAASAAWIDSSFAPLVVHAEGASRRGGWLPAAAAARLADLAAVRGAPPMSAVVMAVRQQRGRIVPARDSLPPASALARTRFESRALNEETLAAEASLLTAAGGAGRATDVAVLAAAVALRAYAQEPVWFPGFPAPTVAEAKERYELAALSFDRSVPVAWRPYYLRMLASSIEDLRRVFPSLTLRGAGIHFGESVLRDTALALHDPGTRTIFLPVATGSGTIAHEIAHDLDWQAARRHRRLRGDYLTDRAVRDGRGRLAAAISGLTTNALAVPAAANNFRPGPTHRPTEVFARSVDWFVAAALAREGRANGYLSTVQDEVLTGYTLVAAPSAAGRAGQALADALDDMTDVPPETRAWFVGRYGTGRDVDAYERLRDVLVLPRATRGAVSWSQIAALPTPALDGLELLAAGATDAPTALVRGACRLAPRDRALHERTLTRVTALATEARIRGFERDGGWWVNGVGPLRPELVEQRAAQRRARLLTRVRLADGGRDPLAEWIAGRAGAACR
jgi:hypothetical protein